MKQRLWMLCAWLLIGPALAQEPPVVQNKTPAMRRAEQAEAENVRLKAELEALKSKPAPLPAPKPVPKPKPAPTPKPIPAHESPASKTPAQQARSSSSSAPEPVATPAGSKAPATPLIANRYQPLGDGAEIKDTKTGLIWQRCAVGMSWNGQTCTGTHETFYFDAAQALAVNGWRVPDKDELLSIVDKTVMYQLINVEAFPATPSESFWSSSPSWRSDLALYVDFRNYGIDNATSRNVGLSVRLVRSAL